MKKIIVFIIGLTLFIGSSSPKETVTWTGAGDKYWDNPQNWSNGKVPLYNDDVVIPKGSPTCVYDNHYTDPTTPLPSKSIKNEGELVVETVHVQTHKFENTQDGNVTVSESATIGLLDGVTEFVNAGSISGKKLEVKGSNEYTSTFTNNGTISTTYLGVENCSEVSNTSEGTISGSIIISNQMNSNSVVTNSGNMTAGSTGSIIIASGSFTNTQTGNIQTGDRFNVICENNVELSGTATSSPNNGGDVYIKANNVEITGTVESGNSEYGHGGNFTITGKNNVWIDGTVKAGDCENSDAGNVWINAGNSLFASKNSQITAGSASYSEYAKDGKVKISAKTSTILGKVSAGSSEKKTSSMNKITGLKKLLTQNDKETFFSNMTIAGDSVIIDGDSVVVEADTLKIMGNYIKFSDNPGFGFIYVDELLLIQTPPGGTVDFSGKQDIEDFEGGLNYKIKIYSNNIIPPIGGFSPYWPPEMYTSDASVTDGYISATTFTDSAGSAGTFELTIQNQSMAAKTFNVGITSSLGWVTEQNITVTNMRPFQQEVVTINYDIPESQIEQTDSINIEMLFNNITVYRSQCYLTSIPVYPENVLWKVNIFPKEAEMEINSSIQFEAMGMNHNYEFIEFDKTWNVSGGSINENGLYTAIENGDFFVAVSNIDGTLTDTAFVHVGTTSVDEETNIPQEFMLYQNYPNPFNPSTVIRYQIPELSMVSLKIFDMLGREVATLVNEQKTPGNYELVFNGDKLSSGVYIYQLRAGEFNQTKKLLFMK